MAVNAGRKKGSKRKRFPYIEVEGIESRYLDAALLKVCGDGVLEHSLSDEFKLIKKAGITLQELKRKERSHKELIELVSPHLLESYDYYNFLANSWDEILQKTIHLYFENDYASFTIEDWDNQIRNLIDEEVMPVYGAINTMRLYKNGEIKELIYTFLKEEKYVVKFYRETGIKIEGQGLDINWDGIIDDELEEYFELEDELEENSLPEVELFERSPDEALRMAAKIILNVSERVSDLEEAEKYKKLYESEKDKVAELTRDLKSRDSQVKSLSKENRALTKSVESLNGKIEQQLKESGRLGEALGEIRKENEDLGKDKASLERRVGTLEKEANSITEKIKKELKNDFDKKTIKMQDEFGEEIFLLEKRIEDLQRLLEDEQAKNSELSDLLETTSKEFTTIKYNLEVVEKERNELSDQVNQALANEEKKVTEDDIMFGFDEEDLEEFVEFDNKPTRN